MSWCTTLALVTFVLYVNKHPSFIKQRVGLGCLKSHSLFFFFSLQSQTYGKWSRDETFLHKSLGPDLIKCLIPRIRIFRVTCTLTHIVNNLKKVWEGLKGKSISGIRTKCIIKVFNFVFTNFKPQGQIYWGAKVLSPISEGNNCTGPGLGFNFVRCIITCGKQKCRVESLLFLLQLLLKLCNEQIKHIYLFCVSWSCTFSPFH